MKSTSVYTVLLGLVLLGGSCKKSQDTVAPATCTNVDKLAEAYSNSLKAYVVSQTKANCDAFKKAGNDYITAASSCPGVTVASINDARESLKSIVCQ
ncbi:MAG: hypothetical protein H7319_08815 [Spirosoma sp.]|nr:hypothetical protein [Spirosoma sp.]